MKRAIVLSLLLGATAAFVQPALANPEKAVKARRGYFQLVSLNAGPLFGMAKGKVAYDAKLAVESAKNLQILASMKTDNLWLKGTDNVAMPGKTRALPAIWEPGSKIRDGEKALGAAAAELVKVSGNGLDSLKGAIGALGKSCGGCHKPYRAKKF